MKNFFNSIRLAVDSLADNKLRTILTVSVIAVGITAIVGIETSLDILSGEIGNSFSAESRKSFAIASSGEQSCRPLTWRDGRMFASGFNSGTVGLRSVVSSSATVSSDGISTDPVAEVIAADRQWLACSGCSLSDGRNFTVFESESSSPVCLIGDGLRKKLFDGHSPIGKIVRADDRMLTVVGCISKRGGIVGGSSDMSVVFPGRDGAAQCVVTVIPEENGEEVEAAVAGARSLMRSVRRLNAGQDDDFIVSTADASASRMRSIQEKLSTGALVIGLVTLLGAAISLMNVMLVGVKERIREIGLRKALGETRKSIRLQFLMEAVFIGQMGALTGGVLGLLAGNLVALSLDADMVFPWVWLLRAMFICLCVSIIAGTMPASRAASLAPVDALRDF